MSEQEIINKEYAKHVGLTIRKCHKDEINTIKEINLLPAGSEECKALNRYLKFLRAKRKEFIADAFKISNQ